MGASGAGFGGSEVVRVVVVGIFSGLVARIPAGEFGSSDMVKEVSGVVVACVVVGADIRLSVGGLLLGFHFATGY